MCAMTFIAVQQMKKSFVIIDGKAVFNSLKVLTW